MANFYVLPPQDRYQGSFIVSTDGTGYPRAWGKKEYNLVSTKIDYDTEGRRICSLIFECCGVRYRCVPGLKKVGKYPAVIVNGRRVVAPRALWPFADPETIIELK